MPESVLASPRTCTVKNISQICLDVVPRLTEYVLPMVFYTLVIGPLTLSCLLAGISLTFQGGISILLWRVRAELLAFRKINLKLEDNGLC